MSSIFTVLVLSIILLYSFLRLFFIEFIVSNIFSVAPADVFFREFVYCIIIITVPPIVYEKLTEYELVMALWNCERPLGFYRKVFINNTVNCSSKNIRNIVDLVLDIVHINRRQE